MSVAAAPLGEERGLRGGAGRADSNHVGRLCVRLCRFLLLSLDLPHPLSSPPHPRNGMMIACLIHLSYN